MLYALPGIYSDGRAAADLLLQTDGTTQLLENEMQPWRWLSATMMRPPMLGKEAPDEEEHIYFSRDLCSP